MVSMVVAARSESPMSRGAFYGVFFRAGGIAKKSCGSYYIDLNEGKDLSGGPCEFSCE